MIRVLTVLLITILIGAQNVSAEQVERMKIGVLSKRGTDITYQRWSDTANYLSKSIPQYQFEIIPLGFQEIEPAVRARRIDFLLMNSGMYGNLSFTYDLSAVATLKRKILDVGYTKFGSVVFTRAGRRDIKSFQSLANERVAAVNELSLGGWIAALREFSEVGISTESFASLNFLGTHDAVVYAVLDKKADVGIVRTDTLERMAQEGAISVDSFKALPIPAEANIPASSYRDFPLLLSSRLYPEWPMSRLPHVPAIIAEKVSSALLLMPTDSLAAVNAKIMGWTIPQNYREIDIAYSKLRVGAYEQLTDYSIIDVIARYWSYFLTALFLISTMIITTLYIITLNKKLKRSQEKLKELATHDDLTGLPNRKLFMELAQKYIGIAKREDKQITIIFLDLDLFKNINDIYGHGAGDALLKDISSRIIKALRDNDIVARIGGDEFLLMLWNVASSDESERILNHLLEVVALPMLLQNDQRVEISCSIGASNFPSHGETLAHLITKADIALYEAKNKGRGTYSIYSKKPEQTLPESGAAST